MAGEQNISSQSGAPKGYIGDTRGQQFINPDPNYWVNKLLTTNPSLKADPYLVTSLTQQFKNSSNPARLANSLGMAKYMNATADHVGLSSLYPTPNTIYDAPAYKAPDKWWQATNDTGNWFKKLVQPVGNVLGSAMGGFIGAVSTPEAGKTVGDFFRAGIPSVVGTFASGVSKLAVGTGRLATGNINDLTAGQGLAPAWRWQDPLYLGEAIKEGLGVVSKLPWMADTYMTNLKSQVNKKGLGTALGEQTGNFIGGAAIGGWIGKAAEGESAVSAIVRAAEVANVQDTRIVKLLTDKLKTEGSITAEEQAALEKAKQDLTSRNKNALHENAYTSGVNEFKQQFPLEHGILEQDLARGAITQQEFDQAIAKGIAGDAQSAFTSASEAINGEQATARAAQDAAQARTRSMSEKLYQGIISPLGYAVGGPLKGIATMARLLGSKSANITYVLGALQAQQNPEDAYIWQLAEQGKVLNADGTTQDLGIEIANSLGIDGMWGTSVRDLVDVGLKWVVDDPIASFFRTVKEARSAYGMTGALGKWFHGTGIVNVGDVFRAYMEYSSVRRAVRWIAKHSAGQINERFGALFLSNSLLEKLGAAKSDAAVLSILEEASQSLILADRVTDLPHMGWYTYAKTALRGETSDTFATLGDALASPVMPSAKIIEAIRKETGSDITARDAEFADGGVALKANILLGQRLRRQFAMRQMINEAGRITDRQLIVGSPRSVKGIGELLKSNYMSDDFIKEVTDQLIRHGNDHQVWNNIYNNAMRISIYRRMLAAGPHADFALFIDNMAPHIDDYIYGYSGVDGGGMATGQAMVADANEMADKSINPVTNRVTVAAVDTPQLGVRIMPSERQFRQLSRFTTRVAQHVTNQGADIFLRSTKKTFEIIRQLAEAAGVKAETYINNFKFEDRAQAFSPSLTGEDASFKGYVAKAREVTDRAKQMLEGEELKSMTPAERYASVVKYLDGELNKIREIYTVTSKKYEQVMMTQFEPDALEKAFGTNINPMDMLNHIYGELKAVEHLNAEMKAAISSSASSVDNLTKQANYLASTADTKEAGELYKEAFMKKWNEDFKKPVGKKIGLAQTYKFIQNVTGLNVKSLGNYEMRNTLDTVVDFSQGYLNGWFKPLTLSTPAWADRVTISEVLLNALRIGGHAFSEAKLVQSIAKSEMYLGKVAVGDVERKAIRFAITNMILGFDKSLARTLKGKEFDDFLDFATKFYLETDGHMLGGVHGQGDLMSEDGFKTHMANQVVSIEKDGIKTSNKILSPNFRKYDAGDVHHGAAMYEAITRVHHGVINKEVARFYQSKIETEGQRIFDSNPEFYMDKARKDAYAELKKLDIKPTDKAMKAQLKKSLDKQIRDIGAGSLSTEASLARLRSEANIHMESFIDALPANVRSSFKRDTEISAKYPNDSPHRGWAKTSVDHVQGIGTDANYVTTGPNATTIYPDIMHQMASGEFQTQQQMAEWLESRYKNLESTPSAIPAHEYVSMFSAGNINPIRKFSEWMHRGLLGKIVNTGSRDPIFMWEAWQQFKKIKPLVDAGYKDMGEAMRFAQTEALVNMAKFVHNPLDKTIWEENMRVVAPYYFAKNQAMRRAFRMGGDDFAAFEKYLKINTAVTDYVALAYNQSGIGSFTFPGSTIIMAIPNGIANSYLALHGLPNYGALKNMGLESSPASPDSIIITGSNPGIGGMIENLIHIPLGPIVSIPAKYVYEQLAHRVPYIGETIAWLLGPVSMQSSIWSDLFPNSTVKNIKNGIYGHMNQQQASSYLSAENHVITQQGQNMLDQFRNEAIAEMQKQGIINKQNINSGSVQQLIMQFALTKFDTFMKDPRNRGDLQDAANWATTALYASKTFSTFFTPLSAVITANTKVQTQLNNIALEKDANGEYKYPNRTLQIAELIHRFPTEMFDVVSNSNSPFSVWNQNLGNLKYVNDHYNMVMEHPYITAFLANQEGNNATYAPAASALFGAMGLRQLQTPKEHIDAMRVASGNQMFYGVMQPQFQSLYPGDYYFSNPADPSTGMSKQGYNAWQAAGKAYANNDNAVWGAHQYGGEKRNTAVASYNDLLSFMKNKDYAKTLTSAQKEIIPLLVDQRQQWEKKYKDAAGEKFVQSDLKAEWYKTMTDILNLPAFAPMSNLITSVFRPLPPPQ